MAFALVDAAVDEAIAPVSGLTGIEKWGRVVTTNADGAERLIPSATFTPQQFDSVSVIFRNEEAAVGENVTIKIYVSNYNVQQTTLAGVQNYGSDITGGGITVNAVGPPSYALEDIMETLSSGSGVDFYEMLANYQWIYFTLQTGAGATAAGTQIIDIFCKAGG